MEQLIRDIRKNRNTKYYNLLLTFIRIINGDVNARLRLTVDDIIHEVDISRPTFYSYYENAEEFYVDLMQIIAEIMPRYMYKKSQEMPETNFLEMAYSFKLGITMSNLKKIAGKFPAVLPDWKKYFENAILFLGKWYERELKLDEKNAQKTARFVLNESILHGEHYYTDFEKYKALMLEQTTW